MFGFQACVLTLAALVMVDIVFVSFRSSLTADRNKSLVILLIMAIHEAVVVVELALVLRLVLSTYWFSAGLFLRCAKAVRCVLPLWVLRLFFTCFPCLYRLYVLPDRFYAQTLNEDTSAATFVARRPWNDGGYGAVVTLDLILVIVYVLALLHLAAYLSEKSLYAPYDQQQLASTRTWRPVDAQCWTVPGSHTVDPSLNTGTTGGGGGLGMSLSRSQQQQQQQQQQQKPPSPALSPTQRSSESNVSVDPLKAHPGASWQRRATEELTARQAWQAMLESGVFNPDWSLATSTSQLLKSPKAQDAKAPSTPASPHVRFHTQTDVANLVHQETSVFAPPIDESDTSANGAGARDSRERKAPDDRKAHGSASLRRGRSASTTTTSSSNAGNNDSYQSPEYSKRASVHTARPPNSYVTSRRTGGGAAMAFTSTAPFPSSMKPSTTTIPVPRAPVADTRAVTTAAATVPPPQQQQQVSPGPWDAAAIAPDNNSNPFFQYDTSGRAHWRRASQVVSAVVPPQSTAGVALAASLRRSSSVDAHRGSGIGGGGGAGRGSVNAGDAERATGLRRFFPFAHHGQRRASPSAVDFSASGLASAPVVGPVVDSGGGGGSGGVVITATESVSPAVLPPKTKNGAKASTPASPVTAAPVSFQSSSSQQQRRQQQQVPTGGGAVAGNFGFTFPTSLSFDQKQTRHVSDVSEDAARRAVPPQRGSRKDHSSLLFRDDPSLLELQSGVVSGRGGQASGTGATGSATALGLGSATRSPFSTTMPGVAQADTVLTALPAYPPPLPPTTASPGSSLPFTVDH